MGKVLSELEQIVSRLFALDGEGRTDLHHPLLNSRKVELSAMLEKEILSPLSDAPGAARLTLDALKNVFPAGDILGPPELIQGSLGFPSLPSVEGGYLDNPYATPRRTFLTPNGDSIAFRVSADGSTQSRSTRRVLQIESAVFVPPEDDLHVTLKWALAPRGNRKGHLTVLAGDLANLPEVRERMVGLSKSERVEFLLAQLEWFSLEMTRPRFVRTNPAEDLKKALLRASVLGSPASVTASHSSEDVLVAHGCIDRVYEILEPSLSLLSESFEGQRAILSSQWLVSVSLLPEALLEEVFANASQREQWIDRLGEAALQGVDEPADLRDRAGLLVDTSLYPDAFCGDLLALIPDLYERREGILIHGDNLDALTFLEPVFNEQIHVAYIDPPYNTGNSSVYIYNDARDRTLWASQMEARLRKVRPLLRPDGLLWTSIDDNEAHTLRFLLEDTFGPQQYVSTVTWRKKVVRGRGAQHILPQTEYIFGYAKELRSLPSFFEPLTEEMIKAYRWSDDRGPYKRIPLAKTGTSQSPRPNLVYPIEAPDGTMIPCPTHQWRWSRETLANRRDEIEFIKKRDGNWAVHTKQRLFLEDGQRQKTPTSLYDRVTTTDGTREIKSLFGSVVADFPKPTELLVDLLTWPSHSIKETGNPVYLDFFAGSGSTGHAVIRQNRDDDGRRAFILVEAGYHFDTVLVPRMAKLAYSQDWKGGVPGEVSTRETAFEVIRLESFFDTVERRVQVLSGVEGSRDHLREALESIAWAAGIHPQRRIHCEGIDIILGNDSEGDTIAILWSPIPCSESQAKAGIRVARRMEATRCLLHEHLPIPLRPSLPVQSWSTNGLDDDRVKRRLDSATLLAAG